MNKINAKIVADSLSPQGERITSYILTYPRFIHAELMTHRMFSRNAASSRAIPFNTMVKMVEEDPFIPIAWQKDHKGMQGTEYFTDKTDIEWLVNNHLAARDYAVERAKAASDKGATKQLCNRLLEPFMWYTVLVTATEWDNFFELRCPQYRLFSENIPMTFKSKKDLIKYAKQVEADEFKNQYDNLSELYWIETSKSQAEIHIQTLAEAMWDAMNESTPKRLKEGEWHVPFGDTFDKGKLIDAVCNSTTVYRSTENREMELGKRKIATARCARLSYMTFDGEIDYAKDIALHDMLLESRHMSPFEHCARAMKGDEYYYFIKGKLIDCDSEGDNQEGGRWEDVFIENSTVGWCNNFRGFIPYRYLIENE